MLNQIKFKAYQVSPEIQESPFSYDEFYTLGVNFIGNRNYTAITTSEYDAIKSYIIEDMEHIQAFIEDIRKRNKERRYQNLTELWEDTLYYYPSVAELFAPLTKTMVSRLTKLCEEYNYSQEIELISQLLTVLTKKQWETKTICGCCQSDWQEIIYSTTLWDRNSISNLESVYFNTGTEWKVVSVDENGVEDEDDVTYVYTTSWRDEDIKQEILDCVGGNPSELQMFKFTGYTQTPIYEEVK